MKKIYPNPPIVEALIQLHFEAEISRDEMVGILGDALMSDYPGDRKQRNDIQIKLRGNPQSGAAEGTVETRNSIMFLTSKTGAHLLGCGDSLLSINVLTPYPGWDSFVGRAQKALDHIPSSIQEMGFKEISVRYIDRIELPLGKIDLSQYFTILPNLPSAFPPHIDGLQYASQGFDPTENTFVTVMFALRGGERLSAILDVDTRHVHPVAISNGDWLKVLENLHERQRDVFESSITQKTRELFE